MGSVGIWETPTGAAGGGGAGSREVVEEDAELRWMQGCERESGAVEVRDLAAEEVEE